MVFGFWNNQISLVFSMLGQSPVNFKGGGPWAIIEGIEPIFVAVGSSLVVLFFVIGFCSESVDVKEEMRFEAILRMLIRLGLAEWFVANNVTIMKAFFTSIGNLVNLMTAGTTVTLSIDSTQADVIKNLGFGESLVMLILAALLSIIVIICGFFVIYTVYFRFLKTEYHCAAWCDCVLNYGWKQNGKSYSSHLLVNTFYPLSWKQSPWHLRLSCAMPCQCRASVLYGQLCGTGQRPLFTCVK